MLWLPILQRLLPEWKCKVWSSEVATAHWHCMAVDIHLRVPRVMDTTGQKIYKIYTDICCLNLMQQIDCTTIADNQALPYCSSSKNRVEIVQTRNVIFKIQWSIAYCLQHIAYIVFIETVTTSHDHQVFLSYHAKFALIKWPGLMTRITLLKMITNEHNRKNNFARSANSKP